MILLYPTKFRVNRTIIRRDIANRRFSIWRPSAILNKDKANSYPGVRCPGVIIFATKYRLRTSWLFGFSDNLNREKAWSSRLSRFQNHQFSVVCVKDSVEDLLTRRLESTAVIPWEGSVRSQKGAQEMHLRHSAYCMNGTWNTTIKSRRWLWYKAFDRVGWTKLMTDRRDRKLIWNRYNKQVAC